MIPPKNTEVDEIYVETAENNLKISKEYMEIGEINIALEYLQKALVFANASNDPNLQKEIISEETIRVLYVIGLNSIMREVEDIISATSDIKNKKPALLIAYERLEGAKRHCQNYNKFFPENKINIDKVSKQLEEKLKQVGL